MHPIPRIARFLLLLHGFLNICQGIYSITSPRAWAQFAGGSFVEAPDEAVQAIGLGALGIGYYQFLFTLQNNRALILATIPLRFLFAAVVANWGDRGAGVYELGVGALAACAAVGWWD